MIQCNPTEKNSFGICKGGVVKAYAKDSKCEQTFWSYVILEGCQIWNVGNGELESPIRWSRY